MKMRREHASAVLALIGILPAGRVRADGPHIPPGEARAIVAQSLAAPREFDIFFGRKDRYYLTGVWKMKWEWNYLTTKWVKANMVAGHGRQTGLWLKPGVVPPRRDIQPRAGYFVVDWDDSAWWDVLVPAPWQKRMPYEKKADRRICDQFVEHRNRFVFGGVGFYRKKFTVPAEKKGGSVVLHFDNVESVCTVWVNGQEVGRHKNYRDRGEGRVTGVFLDGFDCDITGAVRFGGENQVLVRVYDSGVPMPWGTPDSGGITGPVWLEYLARDYFPTVLVTAPYGAEKIAVRCRLAKNRAPAGVVRVRVRPWASPDYTFPGSPAREYRAEVNLPDPRNGWIEFTVPTPGILPWDVQSPNLYELRISDVHGRIMGLERFGVRTFEAKGTRFFLNGKPIFLFGKNTGELIEQADLRSKEAFNYRNFARKQFQGKKAANFNCQRVHTGPAPRLAYYLCDEVGLMVRDEWTPSDLIPLQREQQTADFLGTHDVSASFTPDGRALLPALRQELERWIEWNYNSPSVITWSAGNEMAAGDPNVRRYLTLLYEFMRTHDPQKRPYTPSSGLHWERGDPELRKKPLPGGYLDFHNYGMIYARWIAGAARINREIDDLAAVYAGIRVPLVLGEWLAHGGLDSRLCTIDPSVFDSRGDPVVSRYVRMIRDARARRRPRHPRISREFLARIAVGGCRIARSYLDDARARAEYYHHCVEIVRRDCPRLVGYSIHGWKPFVNQQVDRDAKRRFEEWGGPEFDALAMAQQGLIAIPGFWDEHAFAGRTLVSDVCVINWSRREFKGSLYAHLETRDGRTPLTAARIALAPLAVGQSLKTSLRLPIPAGDDPGACRLLLDLVERGKVVSRNVHHVLVRAPSAFPAIRTRKSVLLYETGSGLESTAALLTEAGVRFTRTRDFANLAAVDVLIIGKTSLDSTVAKKAAAIRRFIERGGRVLVFRQELVAPLPWAPAVAYESCGPVPNADLIAVHHPVFAGIAPRDLQDWGDDHVVYDHWLTPLGANVLAAGASPRTGFAHTSPPDFGMVLAEFRLGRGACLLSQFRIEESFRTDSAVRGLAFNLLRYALETPWSADKLPALENDTGTVSSQPVLSHSDVRFIRLNKFVNRSIVDVDGSGWMGSRAGLDGLPLGARLFGYVPFNVDPKGMAIVLGAAPRRDKVFPEAVKGIGVWSKVKALFFLHTAAYVAADEGAEVLRYMIHYGPSQQETFRVRNRIDIADWYQPKSYANAVVVWTSGGHGIYLTRWDNPHPDRKVSTIDIIAGEQAYIGVLAVTALTAE